MRLIDDLLREAEEAKASDVHVTANRPPYFRVNGELKAVVDQKLTAKEVDAMVTTLMAKNTRLKTAFQEKFQVDFSYAIASGTRFRVNVFRQSGITAVALRLVPSQIKTIEDLNIPPHILQFAEQKQGFVLAAGPTGHGKSTTLAALIDHINTYRRDHIITIEDPIEYQFTDKKSIIDQREIGRDASSFGLAIRATLRQDPDVILIGELRDLETMQTALTLAETGHLVFSTVHTNDAAQTISRVIDSFPANQQSQIRSQLANVLSGVISQRLLPWTKGGRIPAVEIMVASTAIRNAVREDKIHQIMGIMQTSSDLGMQTLESSIQALLEAGAITADDARPYILIDKAVVTESKE